MPSRDTNIGAKRAREARIELGLASGEAIGCVLTQVERTFGLPVIVAPLPTGVSGCCWRGGGRTLLWVNGLEPAARQRFTLAHELGHLRCGHDASVPVETFETLGGKSTDSREVQANAFAAELLAPAAGVSEMVRGTPTLEDVVRIAARYGISTIAALFRLNTLGLADRDDELRAEIDAGLDADVVEHLALPAVEDAIAGVRELPRISPLIAGSALTAMHAGVASAAAVAAASGSNAEDLADGAAAIGL
jgi:hypothetical protein